MDLPCGVLRLQPKGGHEPISAAATRNARGVPQIVEEARVFAQLETDEGRRDESEGKENRREIVVFVHAHDLHPTLISKFGLDALRTLYGMKRNALISRNANS